MPRSAMSRADPVPRMLHPPQTRAIALKDDNTTTAGPLGLLLRHEAIAPTLGNVQRRPAARTHRLDVLAGHDVGGDVHQLGDLADEVAVAQRHARRLEC